MKSKIVYTLLVVGVCLGLFLVYYFYNNQSYVQIVCNFGNKKVFNAKYTNIEITEKDFDSSGNFIEHENNASLQKLCDIPNDFVMELLKKEMEGEDAPSLLEVNLIKK